MTDPQILWWEGLIAFSSDLRQLSGLSSSSALNSKPESDSATIRLAPLGTLGITQLERRSICMHSKTPVIQKMSWHPHPGSGHNALTGNKSDKPI